MQNSAFCEFARYVGARGPIPFEAFKFLRVWQLTDDCVA